METQGSLNEAHNIAANELKNSKSQWRLSAGSMQVPRGSTNGEVRAVLSLSPGGGPAFTYFRVHV